MKTGMAHVPLHGGHCPPWLFDKMKRLGAVMIEVIAAEYGSAEVLRRLSDPVWFQAFGCVLGFDWHSSGLTTVVCGALKEGLRERQGELGLFFAGGKGKASRQTPLEIAQAGETYGLGNELAGLERTSRMVAKVDSAAVQDGYQLYHHFFIFDAQGRWAVVQQGMNEESRYARRYHWLSETLKSFVEDPHQGICGERGEEVLNLVAGDNEATRAASVELAREKPETVSQVLSALAAEAAPRPAPDRPRQLTLFDDELGPQPKLPPASAAANRSPGFTTLSMPRPHPIPSPRRINQMLYRLYERPPGSYEQLLETPGVGPSTLRALAMVAEVTHGARPSFTDPVRYAFAHGGKDGFPFPVQPRDLEHSLGVLRTAVEKARVGDRDRLDALRRLADQEERMGVRP
jgi:hypothetical protein